MLSNDARREARFADGTVVLLRDQDRSLWDFDQIAQGRTALDRALGDARGAERQGRRAMPVGPSESTGRAAREATHATSLGGRDPYVLQAAIAALHVDEPQDWPQLAALDGELARVTGSSLLELNRAAAIAEAGEVEAALALVESLELDRYHYLHARGVLRRLDRVEDAPAAYERALELVHSRPERRFLERRRAELQG